MTAREYPTTSSHRALLDTASSRPPAQGMSGASAAGQAGWAGTNPQADGPTLEGTMGWCHTSELGPAQPSRAQPTTVPTRGVHHVEARGDRRHLAALVGRIVAAVQRVLQRPGSRHAHSSGNAFASNPSPRAAPSPRQQPARREGYAGQGRAEEGQWAQSQTPPLHGPASLSPRWSSWRKPSAPHAGCRAPHPKSEQSWGRRRCRRCLAG